MKLIPTGNKVIIVKDAAEKKSSGGIILTGGEQNKDVNKGTIIAKGEGKHLPNGEIRPIPYEVGDRVLFSRYPETHKMVIDGQVQIICTDDDLMCKFEE